MNLQMNKIIKMQPDAHNLAFTLALLVQFWLVSFPLFLVSFALALQFIFEFCDDSIVVMLERNNQKVNDDWLLAMHGVVHLTAL